MIRVVFRVIVKFPQYGGGRQEDIFSLALSKCLIVTLYMLATLILVDIAIMAVLPDN